MKTCLIGLMLIARLSIAGTSGAAQAPSRTDTSAVELAAAAYAKARLPLNEPLTLEPRARTADTWSTVRSAQQTAALASVLGAVVSTFIECELPPSLRVCPVRPAGVGIVLGQVKFAAGEAEIVVEMHYHSGIGTETYVVVRGRQGWQVSRVSRVSATSQL